MRWRWAFLLLLVPVIRIISSVVQGLVGAARRDPVDGDPDIPPPAVSAGLAGAIEVAAVQGSASASLAVGYGYTGILVAFLARHNPLAIIPVAILLGGINAAGGLIQRRMDLPDATVLVLQGILFVTILFSETFYGRFKIFNPELWRRKE